MEGETHFQELVRWAEERLREQIATVDFIRNDIGLTPSDEQIFEHLTRLETARAASNVGTQSFDKQQKPLFLHDLEDAFRKGLSPDGKLHSSRAPYIALLDDSLKKCRSDTGWFDAISLHAAEYVATGTPMPTEIRRFIVARLKGDLKRPRVKGAPRKGDLLNSLIYAVIIDLIGTHHLNPMRSESEPTGTSACDVVATALVNLRMTPRSYSRIKHIYLTKNAAQKKRLEQRTNRSGPES